MKTLLLMLVASAFAVLCFLPTQAPAEGQAWVITTISHPVSKVVAAPVHAVVDVAAAVREAAQANHADRQAERHGRQAERAAEKCANDQCRECERAARQTVTAECRCAHCHCSPCQCAAVPAASAAPPVVTPTIVDCQDNCVRRRPLRRVACGVAHGAAAVVHPFRRCH